MSRKRSRHVHLWVDPRRVDVPGHVPSWAVICSCGARSLVVQAGTEAPAARPTATVAPRVVPNGPCVTCGGYPEDHGPDGYVQHLYRDDEE